MTADGDRGRLRVVVIGAGYFSAFHVDAWLRNPDVDLVGLCDVDADKAHRLLAHQALPAGSAEIFTDASRMIAAIQPDIVDIVSPPQTHFEMITAALKVAPRAIICQKPFCGTLDVAQSAAALANERGIPLIVHENFRFQPWYRTIRQEIASGRVGDLMQVTFRLRPGDGQGTDAYLARQPYFQEMPRFLVHETAVHWIDSFRYLMGEPDNVYADLRRLNPAIAGEDAGYFIYGFADGRRALFDGNRLVDHAADNSRLTMGELLVEGSEGTLEVDGFGSVYHRKSGRVEREKIMEPTGSDRFGGDCVFALQFHVTRYLIEGQQLENEARSYLRNMEIEEAIYRSAAEGRRIDLDHL